MILWKSASYAVASGAPATKLAYVPMPRQAPLPIDEFVKFATSTSADLLILDVRNADEIEDGVIKGAINIPDEEIATPSSKTC